MEISYLCDICGIEIDKPLRLGSDYAFLGPGKETRDMIIVTHAIFHSNQILCEKCLQFESVLVSIYFLKSIGEKLLSKIIIDDAMTLRIENELQVLETLHQYRKERIKPQS